MLYIVNLGNFIIPGFFLLKQYIDRLIGVERHILCQKLTRGNYENRSIKNTMKKYYEKDDYSFSLAAWSMSRLIKPINLNSI
jgi:hypothetical protein